jgi:AcrR family transcriptional regulator
MAPRGHSADDVARTALRILDDHGLPDLTMRRLATALEVQPSALYWHFPNKQTLLAELSDRIVARMASGAATDLRTEARALRDALLTYRDGAEVVSSTLALGLGAPLATDRLTAAVVADGFDAETASRVATTVLHYVLGFAWHEQQRLQYDSVGVRGGGARAADARPVGGGAVGAGSGGAGSDSAGSGGAGSDSAGSDSAGSGGAGSGGAGSGGAGSGGAGSGGAGSGGAGSGGAGSGGAGTTGAGPADVMPADAGSTGVSTTDDIRAGRTGAGGVGATGDDPVGLATDDFAFGLDLIAAGLRARGRV